MLLTGIPEIDADHERLANAIDEIGRLCASPDTLAIPSAIRAFRDIARDHFDREEALMRASRYHGVNEHAERHAQLLVFLDHIARMIETGSLKCDQSIVQMLWNWKESHIETSDRDYLEDVRRHIAGKAANV